MHTVKHVESVVEISVIDETHVAEHVENVIDVRHFDEINITTGGGGKHRVEFSYADYAGGSLVIGSIPAGKVIQQTAVIVSAEFNAGYFTVGTDGAQGILVATGEMANAVNVYAIIAHYTPETTETYKLFFHGSPTSGEGAVIIYFL